MKKFIFALVACILLLFGFSAYEYIYKINKSSQQEILDSIVIDSVIILQDTTTTEVDSTRVISIDDLSDPSGTINGHEYVDLGLSVKWATCNVGASSPSDYGNYYAWGETRTKSSYTKKNSKTFGKEFVGSISGKPAYDAARANWGGTWRLPSFEEIRQLNKCKWEWVTLDNHNGYKLIGTNGNSIFLPAAGAYYEKSLECAEKKGYYWSGISNEDDYDEESGSSYNLIFPDEHLDWGHWVSRYYGLTIRPVSE